MLGEAWPDQFPELHAEILELFRYDLAWSRRRSEWFHATSIAFTNVFNLRPHDNKIAQLCWDRQALTQHYAGLGLLPDFSVPAPERALFLKPEYWPELSRLQEEIDASKPNLLVALGNTACWALLNATNIGSIRGAITQSTTTPQPIKILPTYHPAGVLYQWSWRPIVVADLIKAWKESQYPELRRPVRSILVEPSIAEIKAVVERILSKPPKLLSCDIETKARGITCVGFAWVRDQGFVIPFYDPSKPGASYWSTQQLELEAWDQAERLLDSGIPIVGQNFLYDLQYLRKMGLKVRNFAEDTMLLHHSHFPEMQKGLGFLGSIYTNEPSWKLMRRKRADTVKKDE